MATITPVRRVFVAGATRLEDPSPGRPLKESIRSLAQNYPMFRWTDVYEEDGKLVGETIEYTLVLPPPKVNG